MDRIVLAYSGGLDTSVAIAWLKERYYAEVITVTMDLGQGDELEAVRDRALAAGALRAHVLDLKAEFARDYVLPALKADALYEDRYPLITSLGHSAIALKLVEIAGIEQATAVAHGGTENGPDRARFDVAIRALNPTLKVIAPACEWGMTRTEVLACARRAGIQVPTTSNSPYRTDVNLWGRTIEWDAREGLQAPPEAVYALTRPLAECRDEAASVEIVFERGVPIAVNGVAMPLLELIDSLTTIAGPHGVGRSDMTADAIAGRLSREIHEAPAAVILHAAHRELQKLVTSKDLERFGRTVSRHYAAVVKDGLWFTPMRHALNSFVESVQERVTGTVLVRLFKGACSIVAGKSPHALDGLAEISRAPVEPVASKAPELRSRRLVVAK